MTALEQALAIAKNLSPDEKATLIQQVMASLEDDNDSASHTSRPSLYGLWAGAVIDEADIDDIRQEMWRDFPRGDI
jgi:hypothetical protein